MLQDRSFNIFFSINQPYQVGNEEIAISHLNYYQ